MHSSQQALTLLTEPQGYICTPLPGFLSGSDNKATSAPHCPGFLCGLSLDLPRQGWPAHKKQSFHSGSSSWRTQKLDFKVLRVSQALATWLSHKYKPLSLCLVQTLPLQSNRELWTLNSRSGVCCAVWRNGGEKGIPLCSLWAFHRHSTPPQS